MEIIIETKVRPLDDKCKTWMVKQNSVEISDEELLKISDRILKLRGEQDE